jgi:hypothetical protein
LKLPNGSRACACMMIARLGYPAIFGQRRVLPGLWRYRLQRKRTLGYDRSRFGRVTESKEVLTAKQLARLEAARNSDKTIMIRDLAEVKDPASRPVQKGTLTWHFKMLNTRDVAFGASKAFIWDAARVNLPEGKKSLAMSVYPAESYGNDAWGRATEYLKKSIEYFSEKWFVYPYPVAVNEAGIAGGMEYPGIVFDGITDKGMLCCIG